MTQGSNELTVDEAHERWGEQGFADRLRDGLIHRDSGLIDVRWKDGGMDTPKDVPDDVVAQIEVGEVRLHVYGSTDIQSVTVRATDGHLPLKVGELVEFEVVAIERTVVER